MEQYWQNAAKCRSRVLKRLIENALLPVVYVICNLIKYLFHLLMFTCISKTRLIILESTHILVFDAIFRRNVVVKSVSPKIKRCTSAGF